MLTGSYRQLWRVGCVAFFLQGAGLLLWSWHLWSRFDLTSDFATFSQAWAQIGSGHLNPYESTFAYNYPHYGYPFWQSHFEILMWPLALLRLIWASTFDLLIIQDLVLAGFGLVAFRFGLEYLQAHWSKAVRGAPGVGTGLLVVLLASPWTYWTASFDFHFQSIAAFFVALCARDVWNGRRRAWWWAIAVLMCGDVAGSYLIGVGIAALLSGRATRRQGGYLVLAGALWIVFIIAIGSGKGSGLAGSYGYLAHVKNSTGVGATIAVLLGIVGHPGGVVSVVRARWSEIFKFIAASGTVGLVSALGFGMALVVLIPNALNQQAVFIGATAAFQNLVAVMFMIIGGVTFLTWIVRRSQGPLIAGLIGCAALIQAVVVGIHWIPQIPSNFAKVNAATAHQLFDVQSKVPGDAEVIASQGVIGRFGARGLVYPFLDAFGDGQDIPVQATTVVFIFVPRQGIELATPTQTGAAIAKVRTELHAQEVSNSPNATVFVWHPRRGTASVHFAP